MMSLTQSRTLDIPDQSSLSALTVEEVSFAVYQVSMGGDRVGLSSGSVARAARQWTSSAELHTS